jgi:hypothetical protein
MTFRATALRHAIPLGYAFCGLTLFFFGAATGSLWPMGVGALCCGVPRLVDGVK